MKLKDILTSKKIPGFSKAKIDGKEYPLDFERDAELDEVVYAYKIHHHCGIASTVEDTINGRKQLLTAVSYVEKTEELPVQAKHLLEKDPHTGEYSPIHITKKLVSVLLDGNGDPVKALYKRVQVKRIIERKYAYNFIYKPDIDAGSTNYEATGETMKDCFKHDTILRFDNGFKRRMPDWFIKHVDNIGRFTRENDILFVYNIHNDNAGTIDKARNALSLISIPAKEAKMAVDLLNAFFMAVGYSNFISTLELMDTRAPVFITKIVTQNFESKYGQNMKNYYHQIGKTDYEKPSFLSRNIFE